MKWGPINLVKDQWTTVPPVTTADLSGKTVVVTGANNGLGFEAAKHFARMSPGKLIMACRSKQRGQAALDQLKEETGCTTAELWLLDLGSFASVKAFAEKFNKECGRLDILVENAGMLPTNPISATADGWEQTCLAGQLPLVISARPSAPTKDDRDSGEVPHNSRLVIVSSEMHYLTQMPKDVMDTADPLEVFGKFNSSYMSKVDGSRYQETKLLNILFTRSLAERLPFPEGKVIVTTVNPGYCYSGIRNSWTGVRKVLDYVMEKALARTTEEGSRQLVWAAVDAVDKPGSLHGAYINLEQVNEPSDYVLSEDGRNDANKIWINLINVLRQVDPRVQDIVNKYLH